MAQPNFFQATHRKLLWSSFKSKSRLFCQNGQVLVKISVGSKLLVIWSLITEPEQNVYQDMSQLSRDQRLRHKPNLGYTL